MKKLQTAFVTIGILAHVGFWVFEIGTSRHAGPWLCGEITCWILIVVDLPVSHSYETSNQSVTWGSLTIGSVWWGMVAAGFFNVVALLAVAVISPVRRRFVAALRVPRPVRILSVAWFATSIFAATLATLAVLPCLHQL